MLNLKERTNNSVQIPDEVDVALYYNDEEKLVLKNSAGVVEEIITTATTPNPKVFKGLITQVDTSDPTIDIIFSNLNVTITPNYSEGGIYNLIASDDIFIAGKTFIIIGSRDVELDGYRPSEYSAAIINPGLIRITSRAYDTNVNDFVRNNGMFIRNPISIEIYE
jgi:hypothetical protein